MKYLEHLNLPKADIKKKFVDDNDVYLISDMNFDKQSITALIFSWYHVNDGKITAFHSEKMRQIIKKIKNDLLLKILVKEYSINDYNSNVSITSSNLLIASFSLF